jgi:Polyketide cyclase / dehydrase and lipid transport
VTSNAYHFTTTWRIPATPAEITAILGDAPALARWWPSVYLRVEELQPGDANGLGKVVRLWTKGWLPYTLRWQFTVTESDPPTGFRLDADGDFVGVGIWTLTEVAAADATGGPVTTVTYDWTVMAEKGVLKTLSFIMKPIFSANHHWAMRRGDESLRLEIARRHAVDLPSVRDAIPDPPGPTFPHNLTVRRPK